MFVFCRVGEAWSVQRRGRRRWDKVAHGGRWKRGSFFGEGKEGKRMEVGREEGRRREGARKKESDEV